MTNAQIKKMIKRHEGYLGRVYTDSLGNLTCGYGHLLAEGSFVPKDVADSFFILDAGQAFEDYAKLKLDLDPVRRAVLIDMLFNLGLGGVLKFKKMLAAIREGDFSKAADEMMDSRWARQVKIRANELSFMMRTGNE